MLYLRVPFCKTPCTNVRRNGYERRDNGGSCLLLQSIHFVVLTMLINPLLQLCLIPERPYIQIERRCLVIGQRTCCNEHDTVIDHHGVDEAAAFVVEIFALNAL